MMSFLICRDMPLSHCLSTLSFVSPKHLLHVRNAVKLMKEPKAKKNNNKKIPLLVNQATNYIALEKETEFQFNSQLSGF